MVRAVVQAAAICIAVTSHGAVRIRLQVVGRGSKAVLDFVFLALIGC